MMNTHPKGYKFGISAEHMAKLKERAAGLPKLAKYVPGTPTPAAECMWDFQNVSWGKHLNDVIGDCTAAAHANADESWTYRNGKFFAIPDSATLAVYQATGGYVPGNPSTDNGADPQVVAKYIQDTGIAGRKIAGWVAVDVTNLDELKNAINWFGGVHFIFNVLSNMVWAGPWKQPAPGGVYGGGHQMWITAYDKTGLFYGPTWGENQPIDSSFFAAPVGALAIAAVSEDWLNSQGVAPNGLDKAALMADLNGGNGVVPVPAPPAPLSWWNRLSSAAKAGVIAGAGAALVLVYLLLTAIPWS